MTNIASPHRQAVTLDHALHSRNKAQEIQGAVLPLAERYRWSNPFLGAVVAGDFTSGSLDQLRSHGFTVLHLPYESIVRAYQSVGIDVQFDERTPDSSFRNRMHEIDRLSPDDISNLARSLIEDNQVELDIFIERLRACLSRSVQKVIVVPLYGTANNFSSIQDAMTFLDVYMVSDSLHEFHRYEVMITFTNGDRTDGSFKDKNRAKEFLRFVAAH